MVTRDLKKYLDMINSQEYLQLLEYYQKETIFDILGVSRQENPHSCFLRWLFDPTSSHGMGDFPLRKLIETLCLCYEKHHASYDDTYFINEKNIFKLSNEKIRRQLGYGEYKIKDTELYREKVIEKQRRADIVIEFDMFDESNQQCCKRIAIIIENKIGSIEHKDQTKFYEKYFKNENIEFGIMAFLQPITNNDLKKLLTEKKKLCSSEEFIYITYQYLMDGVFEPCQIKTNHFLVNEYIKCLGKAINPSSYYNDEEKKVSDKTIVMAVSEKEKELVKTICNAKCEALKTEFEMIINEQEYQIDDVYYTLYCTIASIIQTYEKEFKKIIEDIGSDVIQKVILIINSSLNNYVEFNNKIYRSGQRAESSLGFLAHEMIKHYYTCDKKHLSVSKLKEKINNEIKRTVLKGALITIEEVRELETHDPCVYYGKKNCPIELIKNGKIKDKDKVKFEKWLANCVAYKKKVTTSEEFLSDKYNAGKLYCYDDFIHSFFNYKMRDNGTKDENSKINEYALNHDKTEFYTARIFSKNDIKILAQILEMEDELSWFQ